MLRPDVATPFALTALIWGSTWWTITTQIGDVPAAWSVTYRFLIATPAMALTAALMGNRLAMQVKAHGLALLIGLTQFCGNYMFVYEAERHLTSGIVALLLGLLLVPNAALGWLLLGQRITARFALGSAVAMAGMALLLVNEARLAPVGGNVMLGIALSVGGLLAAAVANEPYVAVRLLARCRTTPLSVSSSAAGTLHCCAAAAKSIDRPAAPTRRMGSQLLGVALLPPAD